MACKNAVYVQLGERGEGVEKEKKGREKRRKKKDKKEKALITAQRTGT